VIHQRIVELGVGVRQYASNGNGCDVSIPEIIRHYAQDEQTRVIVAYIESLPDPRAFLEAAGAVSRRKPILAMKAGRTAEGAKAVSSHTGGMIKQDTAIDLVFEKAGVVAFRDLEELCQAAIGLASQPVPAGNRVGMITNTGGPAIIATDALIEGGMRMPPLSSETAAFLREKLYAEASINNPVDVLATAGPEHFAAAIQALLEDEGIDAVFLNFITPFFVDTLGVAREIAAANRRSRKPIVATVMTEKGGWTETLKVIREAGVPVYDMPDMGARVLAAMGRYASLRNRPIETPVSFSGVEAARAQSILAAKRSDGRTLLSAAEGYELLACYGIPVARYRLVGSVAEGVAAAEQIGYPVVMKVDAETIVHKTESGGVVLGIRDGRALREQADRLLSRFAEASPRLLIQEQLPGGREVIVGAKAVPGLGHIVMFGLGGIYTEVLKDVSFKLTPVLPAEAREMIAGLRASPVLTGARGQAGVDVVALAEIIQRVSRMLIDHPEISELDINPLIALPNGATAVDVRVVM
jgi:acetyltransferase